MDAHHASLGRRMLQEIRQKRAAERLVKTSSGPDLTIASNSDESGGRLSESDVTGLVSQLQDLHRKNMELEEDNTKLITKLRTTEAENDALQKLVNDLVRHNHF